jgi:hypothetical protein
MNEVSSSSRRKSGLNYEKEDHINQSGHSIVGSASKNNKMSPGDSQNLRKGKWTLEEENYANKIIYLFNKGMRTGCV